MIEPITAPITAVLCMLVPVLIGALYYENKRWKRIARRNHELLLINRDLQYRLNRERQRNFALRQKNAELCEECSDNSQTLPSRIRKIAI